MSSAMRCEYRKLAIVRGRLLTTELVCPADSNTLLSLTTMVEQLNVKSLRYVISPNRNITKDGRVIHCIWYNTILSGKDGALESVLSLVLDVTGNMEIELEWLDLGNQLKHEVEVRTFNLSELTAHIQKIAETERAKLARELHDEMGSIMTALHMEVGRLQKKVSNFEFVSDLTSIRDLRNSISNKRYRYFLNHINSFSR